MNKSSSTLTRLTATVTRHPVSDAVVSGVQTTAGSTAAATRAVGQVTAQSTRSFIGFTRAGIMSAGERVDTPGTRAGVVQLLSLMMGSTMIGLGVSLFVRADLGVPAFDVMLTALSGQLGISLGQAGWLFTGLLFLIASLLGQRPRPTALAFTVTNGIAVDTFIHLIRQPPDLAVRIGFVALGTLIIAGAISLVVHTGLGGGSLELLMRAAEARGHNPYRLRTLVEVSIVAAGVLLGGDFGPATIVFVLTISLIIKAAERALADHRNGRQLRLAVSHRATAPGPGPAAQPD